MKKAYKGKERRGFVRLTYSVPLAFKICKRKTLSKLLEGYTSDVSQSGLLCNIKDRVKKGDIIWLSFDKATLNICEELEKGAFIYQNGVIGKVARVGSKDNKTYDVGIQFISRQEDNLTPVIAIMNKAVIASKAKSLDLRSGFRPQVKSKDEAIPKVARRNRSNLM